MIQKRKLIEVALPLEAINRESSREKSIRHGHPSTLHLWWARRPLAAARAVLFAQLVDDPVSDPESFPTEEAQRAERERLHAIIGRLVTWENVRDEHVLAEAQAEILRSTGGEPPAVLDPFAGGGTIPLEAQRLGLDARASDLNPVPVLINKALIELPPKFAGQAPVFPGLAESQIRSWTDAEGLAADVVAYGTWMQGRARRTLDERYPRAQLADKSEATVIAWVWARTVLCPNPACGIEMPLARTWWLGKKKGKETFIVPKVVPDSSHACGRRVEFAIGHGRNGPIMDGTVAGRQGATCVACYANASSEYLKAQGSKGRLGSVLTAVVAEGKRQRTYLPPTEVHVNASLVNQPEGVPDAALSTHSQYMGAPLYGMATTSSLFTNRQLLALMTFSDLVAEARAQVIRDGGSSSYADAVATFLAFGVSKATDYHNALCAWRSDVKNEGIGHLFSRQAIPMVWDYCEANPMSRSSGNMHDQWTWIAKVLEKLAPAASGQVAQADAATRSYADVVVSTDPPYYDNVPYADLSDFFYVWLRRTLRPIYRDLLATMLVPKTAELVADSRRHDGKEAAKHFFEDGFCNVFRKIREEARTDFPITVYYAFRQSESDASGEASTGWETLIEGMLQSGWEITSTWPLRSEMGNRVRSIGSNALASSIVLSLRPRPWSASTTDRRRFIAALELELPDALRRLQEGQVAPVDLPQAAIGPGMAVFSRYSSVMEPDGKNMTVRSALAKINEILDQVLNEQEGDFDASSRFAIAWYRQHGYDVGAFGDANNLANARNTTVDVMDRDGILVSRAGRVQLVRPADLSWDYDPVEDLHSSNWETLHHLIKVLERDGIAPAGDFLLAALSRMDGVDDADLVKELAYLLFRIAEGNGWTKDALAFNTLVTSWPEILDVVRTAKKPSQTQGALDFDEDN